MTGKKEKPKRVRTTINATLSMKPEDWAASRGQGESAGDVKDTTGNPTGKRRDSDRHIETERGKIFGGILRQLIADSDDQLAEYRSKIEKLEQRHQRLLALYEQLQVEADAGEDEELREDEVQTRSEEE
jgi:hypothetical protein